MGVFTVFWCATFYSLIERTVWGEGRGEGRGGVRNGWNYDLSVCVCVCVYVYSRTVELQGERGGSVHGKGVEL